MNAIERRWGLASAPTIGGPTRTLSLRWRDEVSGFYSVVDCLIFISSHRSIHRVVLSKLGRTSIDVAYKVRPSDGAPETLCSSEPGDRDNRSQSTTVTELGPVKPNMRCRPHPNSSTARAIARRGCVQTRFAGSPKVRSASRRACRIDLIAKTSSRTKAKSRQNMAVGNDRNRNINNVCLFRHIAI